MTFPHQAPPPAQEPEGNGVLSTIIPYKNPNALAAYYCGVFSLVPALGLVLGPIAFFLGLSGLDFARETPAAKGRGHAIAGIVLGAIASLLNYGFVVVVFISMVRDP